MRFTSKAYLRVLRFKPSAGLLDHRGLQDGGDQDRGLMFCGSYKERYPTGATF